MCEGFFFDLMLARKVQLLAELAAEGGPGQLDQVQTVLKRPDAALSLRMFPRYTGQDLRLYRGHLLRQLQHLCGQTLGTRFNQIKKAFGTCSWNGPLTSCWSRLSWLPSFPPSEGSKLESVSSVRQRRTLLTALKISSFRSGCQLSAPR